MLVPVLEVVQLKRIGVGRCQLGITVRDVCRVVDALERVQLAAPRTS